MIAMFLGVTENKHVEKLGFKTMDNLVIIGEIKSWGGEM